MRLKIYVPESVQNIARACKLTKPDPEIGIQKFNDDLYIADKAVPPHIDNQEPWQNVVLCVVVNDADYFLTVGGQNFDLEIGSVIKFEGNEEHQIQNVSGKEGRFAGLIWDVERGENVGNVADQMVKRLLQLESEIK